MAIRTIPFGYEFSKAVRVVKKDEAIIVKEVFHRYIEGETFKEIADSLTIRGITYYLESKVWNKNIISRIVDDIRYVGNDEYPSIVTPEVYELAKKKRAEKSTKKVKLPDKTELIKSKLVCAECGKRYMRKNIYKIREKWRCTGGCKTSVYIDDTKLFSNISKAMQLVTVYEYDTTTKASYTPDVEVEKERNMIETFLSKDQTDYETQIKLILDCASKKFDCCSMEYSDEMNKLIRAEYKRIMEDDSTMLNMDLISRTVKSFRVKTDGEIMVELYSGAIIPRG